MEGDADAAVRLEDRELSAMSKCVSEAEIVHVALGEPMAGWQLRWSRALATSRSPADFADANASDFANVAGACSLGLRQIKPPDELGRIPRLASVLGGPGAVRSSACETPNCVLPIQDTGLSKAGPGSEVDGLLHAVAETCVQRGDAPEGTDPARLCAWITAPIVLAAIDGGTQEDEYVSHTTWALRPRSPSITTELEVAQTIPIGVTTAREVCMEWVSSGSNHEVAAQSVVEAREHYRRHEETLGVSNVQ